MSEIKDAHDGTQDAVHQKLRKAIEKRRRSYLWVPADAITFIPYLIPTFYGDGRALFSFGTINQRPAYWVIRGCSTWGSGLDSEYTAGPDFGELSDDILCALEDAFGDGRCGYSGSSLFQPKKYRHCDCEDCSDPWRARWPMVDGYGGCHWGRMDWPKGFETVENPASGLGNLLAIPCEGKAAA